MLWDRFADGTGFFVRKKRRAMDGPYGRPFGIACRILIHNNIFCKMKGREVNKNVQKDGLGEGDKEIL